MPHTGSIFSGVKSSTLALRLSKPSVCACTYWMSTMPSATMTLSMALSSATSRPGLNCSMWLA